MVDDVLISRGILIISGLNMIKFIVLLAVVHHLAALDLKVSNMLMNLFHFSLCKDHHLYRRIHGLKETLPVNKVMLILKQIAQVSISFLLFEACLNYEPKNDQIYPN